MGGGFDNFFHLECTLPASKGRGRAENENNVDLASEKCSEFRIGASAGSLKPV